MKSIVTIFAMFISISAFAQITFEHEFFNSDPEFAGNLHSIYLDPDEMVYASWTHQNIFLYDLDYNLMQTIPVATSTVNGIMYITRSLFDCDPDNIEYMVVSGNLGNSLIEIYREDGTLLESIPYGAIGLYMSYPGVSRLPIQPTPNGTKMFIPIVEGNVNSTRVYGLCGEYPVPCCTSGSSSGISGHPGESTVLYSSAFPNPTFGSTIIQLTLPLSESGVLKLFNSNGQEVKSINVTSGQNLIELNLSDQSAGTYLYRIETPGGVKPTGKVVKQ